MKKIASILLVLMLVLTMAAPALAEGETTAIGSITISDATSVSVAGKTFKAYKILDVEIISVAENNPNGYVYTVPAELKEFYTKRYPDLEVNSGNFDYLVAGEIQKETDMFAFAADALAAAKAANITPGTATAAAGATSVTINNLPLGYYVIEDVGAAKPISALMLQTVGNVDIKLKADKPTIEKKIDGGEDTDISTTGSVDANNAAIGDKVPYTVTSKVPDMTGYTKYYFVVTDTLSDGLTFNNDVEVKIDGVPLSAVKDEATGKGPDYEVVQNGQSFEIIFKNFIQHKDKAGKGIVITYSATLNDKAVIGNTGNPNTVKLTYSNNPNITDNGTEGNPDKPLPNSPVGKTPEDTVITYVTGIELTKVDGEDSTKNLEGAEFKIEGEKLNTVLVTGERFVEDENGTYYKLKDGTYTTEEPKDNSEQYDDPTKKYTLKTTTEVVKKAENVSITAVTDANGVLRFDGLSAGTYTITEIKAPDGYNMLEAPITIIIEWTAPTALVADGTEKCSWAIAEGDTSGAKVNTNGIITLTVANKAGAVLPSTGGMGTTIFYVLGGLLIVAAGVALITRRRMSK